MRISFAFVSVAVLAACPGTLRDQDRFLGTRDAGPPRDGGGSSIDVPTLFAELTKCAGCHSAEDNYADLDLVSPGLAERLSNRPASTAGDMSMCGEGGHVLVVPGEPDQSLLYQKLSSDSPPCGDHMPPNPYELSQEEIDAVAAWIESLPAT